MLLDAEQAYAALPQVDPARTRGGRPVGLRDGALLALLASGLSAAEISRLRCTSITMSRGRLLVTVQRGRIRWTAELPGELGGRLLVWLTEARLWAVDAPVFTAARGPLTRFGICKLLERYSPGRTR